MKKNNKASKKVLKELMVYIKPYRLYVILSLIFAVVTVMSQLYAPKLSGLAIDHIVDKGLVDFAGLKKIAVYFLIVTAIAIISQWTMTIINNKIAYNVVRDIRKKALDHLEVLPLKYLDQKSYGDTVSRIIGDVDQLSDGLLMGFTQLFTGVVTIIATLIFMFTIDIKIAFVVIILTPLSFLIASCISKRTYKMFIKQSEKRGEITGLIDEMVGNEKVVQAFSYEERAKERFDEINEELEEASLKATFFSSLVNPSTRFINNSIYAIIGVIGALKVIRGSFTVGSLTVFLNYATQYTKPFNEISGVINELQNAIACSARVFELINEEPETKEADNAYVLGENEAVSGLVELDKVDFSYVKEKELIKDFCLKVKPGERVAIVGPTGCGKSTIINLLMRFYDINDGSIKVDGHDIREVSRASLRSNYGMVLQETWLKSGTVRENIAYGYSEATDEEILKAAKLTHADSFIRRLPDGYNTVLSEDGGNLSEGQKQLLCITRVMLKLPPMLILDEATSSIDTRTEIDIQKAFLRMMKGRTSFIVAHRLSTIREADTILVMKDGHIIEQGNHAALLSKGGFYHDLYYSQFDNSNE